MNRHTFGDIVVTSHELATQSGLEILAQGGNAVDAAIAANATLGVVAPETCGIGGDLFVLVHRPGDAQPITLNASGSAGSQVRSDHLTGPTIPNTDPASVTVPGCVRGWEWLASDLGSLPLSHVLAPAIDHAHNGFPASTEMSGSWAARAEQLAPQASAQGLYPDGLPPQPGDMIKRPQLEQTLTKIAAEGAAGFYEGSVASDISRAVGGFITLDDLAGYRPEWVQPIALEVFGHTGWTVPPNSQGYLTLATASIFELCDPPDDPGDPEFVHLMVEAYRAVAARRDDLLSDPHTAAGREELLGEELLADLAGQIDRGRAGMWPSPDPVIGGTTHLSVVDRSGMGVSLIQSNFHGIGSGIGAGTAGFFLHNRGSGFTLTKGHRNELLPGRRPAHTLAPTLWTQAGDLSLILGTRGGHQQPQILAQMAAHLLYLGRSPAEAQDQPRWTTDAFGPRTSSSLAVESDMPAPIIERLRQMGHSVEVTDGSVGGWGPVSAIRVTRSGLRSGAADPRVATASAGVR